MPYRFLIIGNPKQFWRRALQDAIAPMGEMDICKEAEAAAQVYQKKYDVIVLDATEVSNPEELITRLRSQLQQPRIVVVTASPTWQHAREAFRAGAIDYIRKYNDTQKLSTIFVETLAKPISG